jgi:hypothetical protein
VSGEGREGSRWVGGIDGLRKGRRDEGTMRRSIVRGLCDGVGNRGRRSSLLLGSLVFGLGVEGRGWVR